MMMERTVAIARSDRLRALAHLALLTVSAHAIADASPWPIVSMPPSVQTYSVGDQMSVNGAPMRVRGFTSDLPPSELIGSLRSSLGQGVVQDSIGAKTTLGRMEGDYYLTIELEPLAIQGQRTGTRGVIAVTDLKAASQARAQTRQDSHRWALRMLAGSKLVSRVGSEDGQRHSSLLVFANHHEVHENVLRVRSLMEEDGYVFEREAEVDWDAVPRRPRDVTEGRTLYFKAAGKEAMVVVAQDADGQSTIVLNTISTVSQHK